MGTYLMDPNVTKCPECYSPNIEHDQERGEILCLSCGMVISETHIDHGPEWRAFQGDAGPDRSRTGAPVKSWNKGLAPSTEIGWKDLDSYGNSIPGRNRAQIYRLRKWQRRIRKFKTAQRNVIWGFSEIDKICSVKELSPMVNELAKQLFRKASEMNLIQGRGIECMVAATIYASCRIHNVPRTLNEIAKDLNMSKRDLGRTFRKISKEMELRLNITNPSDYVSRFCSRLRVNGKTLGIALELVEAADKMGYTSGKDPAGIAASAIYVATLTTGQTRTQGEVSKASGVTEVTIRKRYKEMIKMLDLKIHNGHYFKYCSS
jgi:transcription initiation factor TFIIB